MCDTDELEILREWEVARPDISWDETARALLDHGLSQEAVDCMEPALSYGNALITWKGIRDALIHALREERFGSSFASSMRVEAGDYGRAMGLGEEESRQMMNAMLPEFQQRAQSGAAERARHASALGGMLGCLLWELEGDSDWPDGMRPRAVIEAILDFMPKAAHAQAWAAAEDFVSSASGQGIDVASAEFHGRALETAPSHAKPAILAEQESCLLRAQAKALEVGGLGGGAGLPSAGSNSL